MLAHVLCFCHHSPAPTLQRVYAAPSINACMPKCQQPRHQLRAHFEVSSKGTLGPHNHARNHWIGTGQGPLCSAVFCLETQSCWRKKQGKEAGKKSECPFPWAHQVQIRILGEKDMSSHFQKEFFISSYLHLKVLSWSEWHHGLFLSYLFKCRIVRKKIKVIGTERS